MLKYKWICLVYIMHADFLASVRNLLATKAVVQSMILGIIAIPLMVAVITRMI